jgi:hypothetical protein
LSASPPASWPARSSGVGIVSEVLEAAIGATLLLVIIRSIRERSRWEEAGAAGTLVVT